MGSGTGPRDGWLGMGYRLGFVGNGEGYSRGEGWKIGEVLLTIMFMPILLKIWSAGFQLGLYRCIDGRIERDMTERQKMTPAEVRAILERIWGPPPKPKPKVVASDGELV